jgi:predicted Zn-dependent protease
MTSDESGLDAEYFDGRTSRAHAVRLHIAGGRLHIRGDEVAHDVPLRDLQWPERTRHAPRIAHLRGGGSLHCEQGAQWDAWARSAAQRESLVVRAQQSWGWAAAALLAVLLVCAAGYRWGLPLAARGVLAFVPPSVDRQLGDAALHAMRERQWLRPSERPLSEQQRLRAAFERSLAQAGPVPARTAYEIHFHRSRLGANAFALPGGTIIVTDELMALLDGHEDALVGVLAHEFGHLRHRHGMRQLVQTSLLGAATGVLYGDFSSVLAGVPVVLGHLGYSRDLEREADLEALRVLRGSGRSPQAMVLVFDRLAKQRGDDGLGIALASHPADAERRKLFGGGS